jgi:hypothetical protein
MIRLMVPASAAAMLATSLATVPMIRAAQDSQPDRSGRLPVAELVLLAAVIASSGAH